MRFLIDTGKSILGPATTNLLYNRVIESCETHFRRFNFHMYNFYIYQNSIYIQKFPRYNSQAIPWRMNICNERFEEAFTNETTSIDWAYTLSSSRFLQQQNSISLCAFVIFRTMTNPRCFASITTRSVRVLRNRSIIYM